MRVARGEQVGGKIGGDGEPAATSAPRLVPMLLIPITRGGPARRRRRAASI
jgi:hypothetical protein